MWVNPKIIENRPRIFYIIEKRRFPDRDEISMEMKFPFVF